MSVVSSLELSYSTYQERQLEAVSEAGIKNGLNRAKCSDKFTFDNDHWVKHPYPGYALVSMLDANPDNTLLSNVLQAIQGDLIWETKLNDYLFQLPAPSFHQTVANTLSADRFLNAIRKKGIEHTYPSMIEEAFSKIVTAPTKEPVRMRIKGLSVFGASIGVLGTFDTVEAFNRIIDFRQQFYAESSLSSLGIKCTRPFIGHITLAYFGQSINSEVSSKLYDKIIQLNTIFEKEELFFTMETTGLRRYDELSVFQDLPNYPKFNL